MLVSPGEEWLALVVNQQPSAGASLLCYGCRMEGKENVVVRATWWTLGRVVVGFFALMFFAPIIIFVLGLFGIGRG